MKTRFLPVAVLTLFVLAPVLASADEAAKPIPPVQMQVVAVKSIDAAEQFIKELGVDLPPSYLRGTIEPSIPLIGTDCLATDKPIGMVMFVGADFGQYDSMAFVIPVTRDGATLEQFKKMGATPVDGHAGVFTINGPLVFRRTADHLIVAFRADVAEAVDPAAVASALTDPQTLFRSTSNMKAFRALPPEARAKIYKNFEKQLGMGADASAILLEIVKHQYESFDLNDLTVNSGPEGVRIRSIISPIKVPPLAAGDRPAMPGNVFARFDIAVSLAQMFPVFQDMIPKIADAVAANSARADMPLANQKKQLRSLVGRAAALILDPAATSFGFEIVDGTPVVYIVQHRAMRLDVPTEVQGILSGFQEVLSAKRGESPIERETYDLDGRKITRLLAKDNGKVVVTFDFAERDNDIFIAWSATAAHPIQRLLAGGKTEPTRGPMSGWLDLGALAQQIADMKESPMTMLPPEARKQIVALLHDEKLSVLMVQDGDGIRTESLFSRSLLKKIPTIIHAVNSPPQPGL